MRRAVFVCCVVVLMVAAPVRAQGVDAQGWTQLTAGEGARVVYVSSSAGRDANSGLSAAQAKRTLGAARGLLRDGAGDWLLLRRGDVWEESLQGWSVGGRDAGARAVVGAYGRSAERPVVRSVEGHAFSLGGALGGAGGVSHLAIVGVRFEAGGGGAGASGLWWLGGGDDLLIEDCVFAGGANGIVLQGGGARLADVRVRRCVVADVGGRFGHAQGLYAWGVDGLVIEGSVFDGGGAPPDPERRMVHVGSDNSGVVVRGNLIARSPGDGVLLASGGVIEGNVVTMCPSAITLGGGAEDPLTHTYGVTGKIVGNVVLDCGRGITVENIGQRGAVIEDNTLVRGDGWGVSLGEGDGAGVGRHNVRVVRNTVYAWGVGLRVLGVGPGQEQAGHVVEANQFVGAGEGGASLVELRGGAGAAAFAGNVYGGGAMAIGGETMGPREWAGRVGEGDAVRSAPAYVEPGRSLATYNASLGGAGTAGALLHGARLQSRTRWREGYSPAALRVYIRGGFAGAEQRAGQLQGDERVACVVDVDPVADVESVSEEGDGLVAEDVVDEAGDELLGELAGAEVVGWAGDDDVLAERFAGGLGEQVGAGLAGGVGRAGAEGVGLGEPQLGAVEGEVAVDFVGGDVHEAALPGAEACEVEQGLRAEDVGADEGLRVGDGAVHVALCGEVEDDVGALHVGLDGAGVADVGVGELVTRVGVRAREVVGVAGVGEGVEVDDVDIGAGIEHSADEAFGRARVDPPAIDEAMAERVCAQVRAVDVGDLELAAGGGGQGAAGVEDTGVVEVEPDDGGVAGGVGGFLGDVRDPVGGIGAVEGSDGEAIGFIGVGEEDHGAAGVGGEGVDRVDRRVLEQVVAQDDAEGVVIGEGLGAGECAGDAVGPGLQGEAERAAVGERGGAEVLAHRVFVLCAGDHEDVGDSSVDEGADRVRRRGRRPSCEGRLGLGDGAAGCDQRDAWVVLGRGVVEPEHGVNGAGLFESAGFGRVVPGGVGGGVVELVEREDRAHGDDGFDAGHVESAPEVVVLLAPSVVGLVEAVDGDEVAQADAEVGADEPWLVGFHEADAPEQRVAAVAGVAPGDVGELLGGGRDGRAPGAERVLIEVARLLGGHVDPSGVDERSTAAQARVLLDQIGGGGAVGVEEDNAGIVGGGVIEQGPDGVVAGLARAGLIRRGAGDQADGQVELARGGAGLVRWAVCVMMTAWASGMRRDCTGLA
eukprot:g5631.t1